jgi:arylsulfatase A-like enzyme
MKPRVIIVSIDGFDALIGRFLASLPTAVMDETSVFVVSDHGFLPSTREMRRRFCSPSPRPAACSALGCEDTFDQGERLRRGLGHSNEHFSQSGLEEGSGRNTSHERPGVAVAEDSQH